ncbi:MULTISPECIES: major tail protein [Staphylococcus]|jgi:phi13 family phage major tail protein|uniref:major tail protein n=1 Tax=Staphylococcus TaxID=1279 RepID=UPI00189CA276|nr:major tail protein [Staphylococcus kloosii]MBF7028933.1 phage tail protein [Staphylococcus kloosii]
MAKNYKSFTGLTGFYYMIHGENEVNGGTEAERIKYLQEISVSNETSLESAYGDNEVAEVAQASSPVEVEASFHKLPLEDRIKLFGLEESEDGLVGVGQANAPYVSILFAKTTEQGGVEYVALPKGILSMGDTEGQTKEDGVEFSQDSVTGTFMPEEVEGFEEKKSFFLGADEDGKTDKRDAIWNKLFGQSHPDSDGSNGNDDSETETP